MGSILTDLVAFFRQSVSVLSTYDWFSDTLDLLLITTVVYFVLKLIRDSRAIALAKGILIFLGAYLLVTVLDMEASAYIFSTIVDSILIILVVIFAPELRTLLERMGNSRQLSAFTSLFSRSGSDAKTQLYNEEVARCVNSICKAAREMSDDKVGALIVFEKNVPLGEIIATGTVVDSRISSGLLQNVFYPKAPLHDGAAVVRNNRLYAAGCILPLTARNNEVAKELGTRHRAALGMSEQSDAMVLVVSEETGAMSLAEGGMLLRNLTDGEVRETLLNFLQIQTEQTDNKNRLSAFFSQKKGGKQDGES